MSAVVSALLPRRPGSLTARVALIVVNILAAAWYLRLTYPLDLDVYRIGARVWLHGGHLYGKLPRTQQGNRLPFTYPPVAAVLLAPLSLIPMAAANAGLVLVTIALLAVVIWVWLGRLVGDERWRWWPVACVLPAALFLEPVRSTLGLGQINVILMALVSLDCLADHPRWPRGALVGLAAAVKLTPVAFVLFFLLRRDYRAAGTALASFGLVTAAGFAFAGHDSVRYWTSVVFHVRRIGGAAYAGNQSLYAVLARAGLDPRSATGTVVWLALAVLVIALAVRGMRRALDADQDCLALSLNAFAVLLVSPISWSHHWVWCVPALLTLAFLGHQSSRPSRRRLWLWVAGSGLVVFAVSPQWWFPARHLLELRWAPWEQVLGDSYVLFTVVVLVLAASLRKLTGTVDERADQRRALAGDLAAGHLPVAQPAQRRPAENPLGRGPAEAERDRNAGPADGVPGKRDDVHAGD